MTSTITQACDWLKKSLDRSFSTPIGYFVFNFWLYMLHIVWRHTVIFISQWDLNLWNTDLKSETISTEVSCIVLIIVFISDYIGSHILWVAPLHIRYFVSQFVALQNSSKLEEFLPAAMAILLLLFLKKLYLDFRY